MSVPDVEALSKIADILETDVGTLLGKEVTTEEKDENEIAVQLGKISEQLAIKNRRSRKVWKCIGIVLIGILIAIALLIGIIIVARILYI